MILMRLASDKIRFGCRSQSLPLILIGCGIYFIIASIWNGVSSLFSSSSRASTNPTPIQASYIISTSIPTKVVFNPNPTPACLSWNQILVSMKGQDECVQGIAAQVYPVVGSATTRINFSKLPNTFFVLSSVYVFSYSDNGVNHDLVAGDCVKARDTIRVYDDGRHQIPYMQITELYRCNP